VVLCETASSFKAVGGETEQHQQAEKAEVVRCPCVLHSAG
jgi:hypothetical protein